MRGEAGGEGFLEKVTFKLGHEAFSSVAAEERRHPSAVWMGQQCLGACHQALQGAKEPIKLKANEDCHDKCFPKTYHQRWL